MTIKNSKTQQSPINWRPILIRSAKVSVVVGSVLNIINQHEAIFGPSELDIFKALLTFAVPFMVATYGAYTALR